MAYERNALLEELIEIEEQGIYVQIEFDNKVEIFTENEKGQKYAIAIVDGYKFKVYENLQIELIGNIDEPEKEKLDYIQDGLVVLYDGENNTGEGHSNNVNKWKNIASNKEENDGRLINVNYNRWN